jgi:hypothetical protein
MSSIGDTEKAMIETVRAIEDHLALLPSSVLERWKGIFVTAAHKIDAELNSTMMHRCDVCGEEEYGYRTELPVMWYVNGEQTVCYRHERDSVVVKEPVETEATVEQTLDELLAMV